MDMRCMTPDYERIYAPWLTNPGKLLDLAEYEHGQILLDLAGGPGTVSKEALLRGASASAANPTLYLLDPNPNRGFMTPVVRRKTGYAENVEDHYPKDMFDIVICRQAVGYINMVYAIPGIHQILKMGGKFVFNSFTDPNGFGARTSSSEIDLGSLNAKIHLKDEVRFFEAHIRWFDYIFHMQLRLNHGWGVDFSCFRYWDPKTLHELLTPWFKVDIQQKGKSVHWICTKEDE